MDRLKYILALSVAALFIGTLVPTGATRAASNTFTTISEPANGTTNSGDIAGYTDLNGSSHSGSSYVVFSTPNSSESTHSGSNDSHGILRDVETVIYCSVGVLSRIQNGPVPRRSPGFSGP